MLTFSFTDVRARRLWRVLRRAWRLAWLATAPTALMVVLRRAKTTERFTTEDRPAVEARTTPTGWAWRPSVIGFLAAVTEDHLRVHPVLPAQHINLHLVLLAQHINLHLVLLVQHINLHSVQHTTHRLAPRLIHKIHLPTNLVRRIVHKAHLSTQLARRLVHQVQQTTHFVRRLVHLVEIMVIKAVMVESAEMQISG